MSDASRTPLDYERLRRRRRVPWRERVVDVFAISLALLWPLWAFGVTRYLTTLSARSGPMPPLAIALIVATFALPIGFGLLVAGFVPGVGSERKP